MKRNIATRSSIGSSPASIEASTEPIYTSKNGLKLPIHMLGLNIDVDMRKEGKKQKVCCLPVLSVSK